MKLKIEFHLGGVPCRDQDSYALRADGTVLSHERYHGWDLEHIVEARLVPDPDVYIQEWGLLDVDYSFDTVYGDNEFQPTPLTDEEKRKVLRQVEAWFDAGNGTSWSDFDNAVASVVEERTDQTNVPAKESNEN
jgi:hypothetical protein